MIAHLVLTFNLRLNAGAARIPFIRLCLFLIAGINVSCVPIKTRTDYDKALDYSVYKTYELLPNEQPDLVNLPIGKDEMDKLILKKIQYELTSKGYIENKEEPDLRLSYYIVTNAKTDVYYLNDYYSNIGVPVRSSTRDSYRIAETTYEQGILIIDAIDANTNVRVWRGYSETRIGAYRDEEHVKSQVSRAVRKILTQFLPS